MTERASRILLVASALVVVAALAATLAWAVVTLGARPLDGVEGDVLFEAQRLAEGAPLYTDPRAGVFDYGRPPARYLVLYPPLWSSLLALAPLAARATIGRVVAAAAWFGVFAWIVRAAPEERRRIVGFGAAFVAGIWVLGLYGASARPDAIAVALAGLALERTTRHSARAGEARIDVVSGVLFALAAWTKPNVVGAAPGAFLACALAAATPAAGARRRIAFAARAVAGGLAGLLGTSALVAGALTAIAGRAWVEHLLASTGQPPSLALFMSQLESRLPFFALPLGACLAMGLRARRDPRVAIAVGALASSTVWAIACLAKIGSAANYFMEPCVVAVVVLARAPWPRAAPSARAGLALAAACMMQVTWNGVASVRSAVEAIPLAFERRRVLAEARAICGAPPGSVVLADEPGLELMLGQRIVQTPFQSTHQARRGRFPVDAWIADVTDPRAACLIMQDDLLERPPGVVAVEHDRFGPELRAALAARFELAGVRSGYRIYRAKR